MLSWVVIDVVVMDRSSSFVSLVLCDDDDDGDGDGEEGVVVGGRRRKSQYVFKIRIFFIIRIKIRG